MSAIGNVGNVGGGAYAPSGFRALVNLETEGSNYPKKNMCVVCWNSEPTLQATIAKTGICPMPDKADFADIRRNGTFIGYARGLRSWATPLSNQSNCGAGYNLKLPRGI